MKRALILMSILILMSSYSLGVSVELDDEGWNSVSVPEETSWETFDDECGVTHGPVTLTDDPEWDFTDPISDLKPETGYFMKVEENCEIEFEGSSVGGSPGEDTGTPDDSSDEGSNDEDSEDDSEEESEDEEESENSDDGSDEPIEEIVYYDQNGDELVSIDEDGETATYGMYDGSLEGEFAVEGTGDISLDVTNLQNAESLSNPSGQFAWFLVNSAREFNNLKPNQCNTFQIEAETEEGNKLEGKFKFYPNYEGNDLSCE